LPHSRFVDLSDVIRATLGEVAFVSLRRRAAEFDAAMSRQRFGGAAPIAYCDEGTAKASKLAAALLGAMSESKTLPALFSSAKRAQLANSNADAESVALSGANA
jgi:hypothetical protein